ncbi:hypothetical protein BATDEDRAFT_22407 [Batrachochytrium dendrobatidis JAM81]|uniref:Uncharacterized protein n=2 Tax=Batrachochytrium dendrobatidis TaxID=109871 RepID=F4NU87_BATDJ|nr:uncharacterized protein BATDEDRAFT_22407 [Batrachochytrium dendrobatidis JAM81]EGF84395.1 hypothetical protein BATDEDRAFT_22407 [Batrachochytrium dendrobatidis JAM81]KAJ8327294.1 hypothetical protein O5D80_004695 [Batrachochytrium dendrobatidis]KAK5665320.1 hypothetical protein QVD99_008152 [Batrachochytrium dendrobatidis]OAJ37402.1 hypothetical protein BDEG_21424 [Batrachochytrium dendrobatidis JEL423]|eukprot:XP_006675560.1 hypothetical protein BATDEDRAFT_22407 [Batrachochytrium dendrobatidis JAM81]
MKVSLVAILLFLAFPVFAVVLSTTSKDALVQSSLNTVEIDTQSQPDSSESVEHPLRTFVRLDAMAENLAITWRNLYQQNLKTMTKATRRGVIEAEAQMKQAQQSSLDARLAALKAFYGDQYERYVSPLIEDVPILPLDFERKVADERLTYLATLHL